MVFDLYSVDLAEDIYWFMEDYYDDYCEYIASMPFDFSLAEYVDAFLNAEFKTYMENKGYIFEERE